MKLSPERQILQQYIVTHSNEKQNTEYEKGFLGALIDLQEAFNTYLD